MRTTTIPPLRVTPELRRDAETVLRKGESLFEIKDHRTVTVLAISHQREDDYP